MVPPGLKGMVPPGLRHGPCGTEGRVGFQQQVTGHGFCMSQSKASTPTADQLERDIAAQREQLADDVEALRAKLDVKTRARTKVEHLRGRVTTEGGRPQPALVAAVVFAVAAVGGLVYLRRRR